MKELEDHSDKNVVAMLIGNKSDLNHLRAVTTEEGLSFASQRKVAFLETSALDGTNVQEAFDKILENIYTAKQQSGESNEAEGDKVGPGRSIAAPNEPFKLQEPAATMPKKKKKCC